MTQLFSRGVFALLTMLIALYSMPVSFAETVILPAGTRIPLTVYNTVSSDNLKTGDMVSAAIRSDVTFKGVRFFKAGDNATLNVMKAKPATGHGGAGYLSISGGRAIDVQGQEHAFGLSLQNKGVSKRGWGVVASILGVLVILVPFGIWVEGGPATLQGGAVYDGLTTTPITFESP